MSQKIEASINTQTCILHMNIMIITIPEILISDKKAMYICVEKLRTTQEIVGILGEILKRQTSADFV